MRPRAGWRSGLCGGLVCCLAACSGSSNHDAAEGQDAGVADAAVDGGLADGGEGADVRDSGGTLVPFFAFGTSPEQSLSAGPFPSDLYRDEEGRIRLEPLEDDPLLSRRAARPVLQAFSRHAAARSGFGIAGPIWFFCPKPVDEATLAGRALLLTLSGPEAGQEVPAEAFYSAPAEAVGVVPARGSALLPGSTYGVVLLTGLRTTAGEPVPPVPGIATLLSGEAPGAGSAALAARLRPLGEALAQRGTRSEQVLVASVFTTEEVLPYARALFDAVATFPLQPPTRQVGWDPQTLQPVEAPPVLAAELDTLFGVPLDPYRHNPGLWDWNREDAGRLPGGTPYRGGTGHFGLGAVLNGSLAVPVFNQRVVGDQVENSPLRLVDGRPVTELTALAPFTLFLCAGQPEAPADLPLAVFSHGGGSLRSDAVGWANANCRIGLATLALDMVFHGGRRNTALLHDPPRLVPTTRDRFNVFTGLREGEAGFTPDWIGDRGNAEDSVGPLYAITGGADPLVIEANLLTIAADTATLLRAVREADWSGIWPGLSFDPQRLVHESLSFGTSFHTSLLALDDGLAAIVGSVGSGSMLAENLLQAPSNAVLAVQIVRAVLGLHTSAEELLQRSLGDPVISLHQWLHQRGDSLPYAPYLLRHRPGGRLPPVLHSGDSWDETLYPPTQLTYARALGLPVLTAGPEWTVDPTVPGAASLGGEPAAAGGVSDNAVFGDRRTSAAIFFRSTSCHGQAHSALCSSNYEHPYPPIRRLAAPVVSSSPVCALQAQLGTFLQTALAGGPARIVAPAGSCVELYGP
ncbi:MAG: hypothetical protein RBU45_12520 [Myxococcota bacterium]|nr:hypothetical protein [Myxococcota bacterium]